MGYFEVKGRVLTVMRLTSRLSLFRKNWALSIRLQLLTSSDSERIYSAQFFRNSDNRDVSRIAVSTLPLTSKYRKLPEPPNQPSNLPLTLKYPKLPEPTNQISTLPLTSKYPKLPEPPNQPSILTGEIHSEDTPQHEPWTPRLRPPAPSLENGSKRRAETSSKTLKPTRRYRKNL